MGKTKIEWATHSWSPVTGCTPISPGCKNCYAKRMAQRLAGRFGYPEAPHHFDVTLHPDRLEQPLKWKKPCKIFVCSMSDLFHDAVNTLDPTFIREVFAVMALSPHHVFQLLTKRPRIAKMTLTDEFVDSVERAIDGICDDNGWCSPELKWPLSNVWLGVTAENQEQADRRIPILLQIPAVVYYVSVEPMLEKINFDYDSDACHCGELLQNHQWETHSFVSSLSSYLIDDIDQVICGAETGPGKRLMKLDWARNIRDQCQSANTPFFFKKDSQGNHELDGRTWEEFPIDRRRRDSN